MTQLCAVLLALPLLAVDPVCEFFGGQGSVDMRDGEDVRTLLNTAYGFAAKIVNTEEEMATSVQIAKAAVEAGDLDVARAVLSKTLAHALMIRDHNIRLQNVLACSKIMVKAGDTAMARAVLNREVRFALSFGGTKLDAWLIIFCANEQIAVGDVAAGKETLRRGVELVRPRRDMPGQQSDLAMLSVAQARGEDLDEAVKTIGGISDISWKRKALADVIDSSTGRNPVTIQETIGRVKGVIESIKEEAGRNEALAEVAKARARVGDIQGALETADAFASRAQRNDGRARGPNRPEFDALVPYRKLEIETLLAIAAAKVERNERDTANKICQRAITVIRMVKDPSTFKSHLASAADILAKTEDFGGADRLARSIPGGPDKADAFVAIALVYLGREDVAKTNEYLKEARREVENGVSFGQGESFAQTLNSLRDFSLSRIAVAQAKVGDVDGSLASAMSVHDVDGLGLRSTTVIQIVEERACVGDYKGAVQAIGALPVSDPLAWGNAFESVAKAWVLHGNLKEAVAWAEGVSKPSLKARALAGLALGVASRADSKK